MSGAYQDLKQARELPDGDVIRILLEQHARIRTLFADVRDAHGDQKQTLFDELRALLAVHEAAEEMLLRPVSRKTAGDEVAEARNHEEAEATEVLAQLEGMDVNTVEFDREFAQFERSVSDHAEQEEEHEFPAIVRGCDADQRASMGKSLMRAEATAPTHPHPGAAGSTAAQWTVGPFASMLDRVKDSLGN